MKMIERVAMVLFAADGMKHSLGTISLEQSWAMSRQHHAAYLAKARAAVEAMLEPSDDMLAAGAAVEVAGGGWDEDYNEPLGEHRAREGYKAMLTHALSEATMESPSSG